MVEDRHTALNIIHRACKRLPCLLSLIVFAQLVLAHPALGQEVQATLSDSKVPPGEAVQLTIKVNGNADRVPRIPAMDNIRTQFIGQQTSFTSMNLRSIDRSISYNFLLTPMREGVYTIPAIPVQVEGRVVETPPLRLEVTRGRARDSGGTEEDVFVEVELEPRDVYVGQEVTQTLRVFTAVRTGDSTRVDRRSIPDTIEEQLDESVAQTRYRSTVNGRLYQVEEARWVFYPVTSGTLDVPSMEITVPVVQEVKRRRRSLDPFFDDFFSGRHQLVPRVFQAESQTINVRPIPQEGRPKHFSGLVGRFLVNARISDTTIELGDSLTLSVEVEGSGNVRSLNLPDSNIENARIYDDSPIVQVEMDADRKIRSRKSFKRAIVPQKAGQLEIPPLEFSYFNPKIRKFVQLSTPPFKVRVTPGAHGETTLSGPVVATTANKEAVQVMGEDILPIHTGDMLTRDRAIRMTAPATLGLLVLPALVYFVAFAFRRLREKRLGDPATRQKREALRRAREGIKSLKALSDTSSERSQLDQLSRIFKTFLGDKLSIEGAALTAIEANSALEQAEMRAEIRADVQDFFEMIEQARYAPGESGSSFSNLLETAQRLMTVLDKSLGAS